jgi:outer membrane murein-binding lipoprotein Lpp
MFAAGFLGLASLLLPGCGGVNDKKLAQLVTELQTCREANAKLQREKQDLEQTKIEQEKKILTLMGLGEKRLDLLFTPTALQIGQYSGPLNESGKEGDEGIRVYLKPVDRDGSVIKAAGSVKIELFDLARSAMIGCYDFSVQDVSKHWESGFITYHYRFDCLWQTPPSNPEITVRAVFTDYLTGTTLSDQKLIRVKLPPASQAATQATQPASPIGASCPASGTMVHSTAPVSATSKP